MKLQCGDVDTAFVYSYGKSSPGSLRDVLATQLDPYYVAPLWPDSFAIEGPCGEDAARVGDGLGAPDAEIASRSRTHAASNPHAIRTAAKSVEEIPRRRPGRRSVPAVGPPGIGRRRLRHGVGRRRPGPRSCDRPVWIRGIDHRTDAHTLGARDLTSAMSASIAAEKAGVGADKIDFAELHAPFTTSEAVLTSALGWTTRP